MQTEIRIIDRHEVERLTTLRKTSIYRLMKEGRFPKPLRLTSARVAWRLKDIQAWIESLEFDDKLVA